MSLEARSRPVTSPSKQSARHPFWRPLVPPPPPPPRPRVAAPPSLRKVAPRPVHLEPRCPPATCLAGTLHIAKTSTALVCHLAGAPTQENRAVTLRVTGIQLMSLSAVASCTSARQPTTIRMKREHQ